MNRRFWSIKKILILLSILSIVFFNTKTIIAKEHQNIINIPEEMRGCWISYIDIENNLKNLEEDDFKNRVNEMFKVLEKNNINTVFFQVRPMGDSIYLSDLFHVSKYISDDGNLDYDPLEIVINEAHKHGISFHAWINPYRLSLGDETTDYYKATRDYITYNSLIIEYKNVNGETALSLNPKLKETTMLICEGVKEIIYNYDVDGIHFDDYFYVYGIDDMISEDEKMQVVNDMVSKVYDTIKSYNNNLYFGISPAGNVEYAKSQGADIESWLSCEGYVDYIISQIYWTDNYIIDGAGTMLFSERCSQWSDMNMQNKKIYVGLALYKVGKQYEDDLDWSLRTDNIRYQYNVAKENGFSGYSLFRYEWLDSNIAATELDNLNKSLEVANCNSVGNEKYEVDNEMLQKIMKNIIKILKIMVKSS